MHFTGAAPQKADQALSNRTETRTGRGGVSCKGEHLKVIQERAVLATCQPPPEDSTVTCSSVQRSSPGTHESGDERKQDFQNIHLAHAP